jgi:energy-converting hydrogenase Eha subunit F
MVVVVVVVHSLVVWVVTLCGLLVVHLQFRARCCLSHDNTLWPRPVPASSLSCTDLIDHVPCSLPV